MSSPNNKNKNKNKNINNNNNKIIIIIIIIIIVKPKRCDGRQVKVSEARMASNLNLYRTLRAQGLRHNYQSL